ncbi:type II toxin-antitoxin system Phd/YefM family antitoxin [Vibrio parahaemolyticus]|uniref:type II toxin-antitoxin system Phd/YefM family antitoxin n=1 Tax=Vibrio parahaemolyticus TaxID=670 RepID=UPI0032AF658D
MRHESVSYLKQNAANLDLDEPMIITQNGKPVYVIESYEQRVKRDEALALLSLTNFAKDDIEAGRVMSSEQLKANLAQRKNTCV